MRPQANARQVSRSDATDYSSAGLCFGSHLHSLDLDDHCVCVRRGAESASSTLWYNRTLLRTLVPAERARVAARAFCWVRTSLIPPTSEVPCDWICLGGDCSPRRRGSGRAPPILGASGTPLT